MTGSQGGSWLYSNQANDCLFVMSKPFKQSHWYHNAVDTQWDKLEFHVSPPNLFMWTMFSRCLYQCRSSERDGCPPTDITGCGMSAHTKTRAKQTSSDRLSWDRMRGTIRGGQSGKDRANEGSVLDFLFKRRHMFYAGLIPRKLTSATERLEGSEEVE